MKRSLALAALYFFALALPSAAQTDADEELSLAKFKAIFIYNFIEYVRWPEDKSKGPLVVGILGQSNVEPYLRRIVATHKEDKRPIIIEVYETAKIDLSSCHLLFVTADFDEKIDQLYAKWAASHVMLVGEAEDSAAKGASIRFKLVDGKLKFEISTKNLRATDLSMSSHLLRLGLSVD